MPVTKKSGGIRAQSTRDNVGHSSPWESEETGIAKGSSIDLQKEEIISLCLRASIFSEN